MSRLRSFLVGRRTLFLLLGILALLALPLLFQSGSNNYTWDETNYYVPAIAQIRTHWPRIDLATDSLSATAPGYAHFLAGISFLTGQSLTALRLITFAVSAAVLVACWWRRPAGMPGSLAFWALAPLATSNFFVKSSAHVVTDNAALLFIVLALAGALFGSTSSIGPGLAAAAATWMRQSSLWLVAPLAVRGWFADNRSERICALLAVIPALTVVALLWCAWHGLVPPAWRETNVAAGAGVFAALAYFLAVFALFGPAFLLAARSPGQWFNEAGTAAIVGGIAGLLVALAGPNFPDATAGRWGGYLWNAAAHLPVGSGRSLLFLVLAPVGGAVIGLLGQHLRRTGHAAASLTWLTAVAAVGAANAVNREVFQRYFEPPVLVLLAFWLFLVVGRESPLRVKVGPLTALTIFQTAITVVTAYGRTFGYL